jgi:drug/metabolite transporter (DMT)-like permease
MQMNWAYAGMLIVVVFNILANIMMKIGGDSPRAIWFLSWKSIIGLSVFGVAGILYARILKFIPLHEAQIIASLQYVGVILAAALILGEPISQTKLVGISLIALGIAICYR